MEPTYKWVRLPEIFREQCIYNFLQVINFNFNSLI